MRQVAIVFVSAVVCVLASCGSDVPTRTDPTSELESSLIGTWKGSPDLPEGHVCIESCERTLTLRRDHTFETSDACPGYAGTWKIRSDGSIRLTESNIDYADEDGLISCAAGSTFTPDNAVPTNGRLEVPFDDETKIQLTKVPGR